MTEAKTEKISVDSEKEREIKLSKFNAEIASLLLNEPEIEDEDIEETEKSGRLLAYEKMNKIGASIGNRARYQFKDSKGRLFQVDMWNDKEDKGEPQIFFKSIDGSESRTFSCQELGRAMRNGSARRIELVEETNGRETEEKKKKEEVEDKPEKVTAEQVVESIVTPEVIEQYCSQVNIGEDRENEAIDSFKDELAGRFDDVDLADSVAVQEALNKFFDFAKNKNRPLVKIIKKQRHSSEKKISVETRREKGIENKKWEKRSQKEIVEDYLVEKILSEYPKLADIDEKTVRGKLKVLVANIEKKMKEETSSGLDGDHLSFGSVEEMYVFINQQLVNMVDEYVSVAVDLFGKDNSEDKRVEKKDNENENETPESMKEFRGKYNFNVFYVNKNDASDLTVVDYDPKNKQVTVHLSYKFRKEPPEETSKSGETTPVWSIDQRGGKKVMFYEKFEELMEDYVIEGEFHKKEFRKEERDSRAKKVEDVGQKYENKKGETLETFKYKRGDIPEDQRDGKKTKRKQRKLGTVSFKLNGGKVQEASLADFSKIKEEWGFSPVEDEKQEQSESEKKDKEEGDGKKVESVTKVDKKKEEKREIDEFDEREKKVLHAFGRFAVVWLDDIEKYDYEGVGIQVDKVEGEKRRQREIFWKDILPDKIKEKGGFRTGELEQKAITQIEREFEK
ncbi:MAG: hypothetical protein U9O20_04615 [Patescibacteria group bacterium]|nr:hypothetical protein [Patescibacteria group bacterium]